MSFVFFLPEHFVASTNAQVIPSCAGGNGFVDDADVLGEDTAVAYCIFCRLISTPGELSTRWNILMLF